MPTVKSISLQSIKNLFLKNSNLTDAANSTKKIQGINVADNFANDAAAATGGIAVGGLYHTAGAVKVRLV